MERPKMSKYVKFAGMSGLALTCSIAGPAFAQTTFYPYAEERFEHSNNIFELPNSSVAASQNGGDPQLSDSFFRSAGGLDVSYQWDRQKLFATAEGRYIDYDHFKYLDHS